MIEQILIAGVLVIVGAAIGAMVVMAMSIAMEPKA